MFPEYIGSPRESKHAAIALKTGNADWYPLEETECTSRYALGDLYAGYRPGVPVHGASRVTPHSAVFATVIASIFSNC